MPWRQHRPIKNCAITTFLQLTFLSLALLPVYSLTDDAAPKKPPLGPPRKEPSEGQSGAADYEANDQELYADKIARDSNQDDITDHHEYDHSTTDDHNDRIPDRLADRIVMINADGEGDVLHDDDHSSDQPSVEQGKEEDDSVINVIHDALHGPSGRKSLIVNNGQEKDSKVRSEKPKVLSESEQQAEILYNQGMLMLNNSRKNTARIKEAFKVLTDAALIGHTKAEELVGLQYLFGEYLPFNPRKAKQIFERLAVKGSPKGQMGLGFIYTAGVYTNSSQAKALVYLTFAALGDDEWAQMALGYRYWSGISLAQNCESALTYYRKVAEKVAGEVQFIGGPAIQKIRLLDETENPNSQSAQVILDENLLHYYKFLADKGDEQAQVGLAQLYLTGGRGVEQNHQYAYYYFKKASETGNANADAYLGKMYLDGTSATFADNTTAYKYFKRAADKNNPIGMSGLGIMYLYGRGVERDYDQAYSYFVNASEHGWVDSQLNLGHMYFNGIGVKRDYKMASRYFQLASQSGHVLAFYNLAQMHATGTGMLRNCPTAVELYKNVAERGRWSEMLMDAYSLYKSGYVDQAALKYYFLAEMGYEVAQSNLAYLLDSGKVSMFDKEDSRARALLQWQRSANQGYGWARVKVGDCFYYGSGTDVDYEAAVSQYKLASDTQHNAQAMFNLGYMYEQGLGTKKDLHLAKRFYDMAAETSVDAQVPVTLALMKLSFVVAGQFFQEKMNFHVAHLDAFFGTYWDVYLMTALIGLVLILLFTRRQR